MIGKFFKNFWWLILPALYLVVMLLYVNYIYSTPYPRPIDGITYHPFGIFPGYNILTWWFSGKTMFELASILIPEYAYIVNAFILMIVLGFVKLVFIILRRNKNASTY